MKILYVTDLHGDKKKYRKILDVAIEKEIKVIVNGGDMLPKQCDRHSEQSFFINGFLDEYFEELKKQDITYLAMLGNDDLLAADEMFDNLCDRFENVCNIAGRKFSVNGYEFIGMNYILDHPFGCKDRVVTETHYIPQRQLSPVAGISNAVDYDRIYNWLEYSRTELLVEKEGLQRLKDATVMVLGVGGVGSHCIEALARSGVGRLILVDNDKVTLTNINRQSIAYHSTIGQYKTKLMKDRIWDISSEIEVITHEKFILPENLHEIFDRKVDYIIDAIDTVTAKLALVEYAKQQDIPIISCMGTGNKLHPELFEITDISKTSVCPLCKVMRKELKERGIKHLKVLYSKEKPVDTSGKSTGENMGKRRALPGSISFVPPVAGLLIAGEVIRTLAGVE